MRAKRYRDRTVVYLVAALAYVFVANTFGPLGANRSEIFPFFNWSLFTNATVAKRYDYAIYIEKLNNRPLETPTLIYQLKQYLKGVGVGINLRKATVMFATSILAKDSEKSRSVRQMIERTYLGGPEQLTYSVRLITYEPLERYRTGKVSWVTSLGTFEKGH
ncbi:MAG: hypothetical protein OEO83_18115 [Alphaproteobacteria bacterium]|nr:hypothetical protein [Alphaproteobacteria bacterium]